jgi:archaellum biogenesis protein FlaJ (TadC family)
MLEDLQEKLRDISRRTILSIKPVADFWKKYVEVVHFSEIKLDPALLVILTVIGTFVAFFIGSFFDVTFSILLAVLVVDLGLGLPFFLTDRKIEEIEARLPDVLHHIGTTLKTGGTVEIALREVTKTNYGPITKGIKEMLREINEGKTFEDAFRDFAIESRSSMLRKVAVIIIAAKKSGGALVDTLTAMAEDIRAVYRLKRERKTKTLMQFLFILVAGLGVAPFVFGIVKSVLEILMKVGSSAEMAETTSLISQFDILFKIYLIIAATLIIVTSTQVREGKISKSIVYIPIGIIISYIVYVAVSSQFLKMIGG